MQVSGQVESEIPGAIQVAVSGGAALNPAEHMCGDPQSQAMDTMGVDRWLQTEPRGAHRQPAKEPQGEGEGVRGKADPVQRRALWEEEEVLAM